MRKHYNTILIEKIVLILLTIALAAAIGLLIGSSAAEETSWDTCYGMTNTHISWQQTYYPSSWELVEGKY